MVLSRHIFQITRFHLLFLVLPTLSAIGQTFAPDRVTTWQNAGLTTDLTAPGVQVDITAHGADNTGAVSCNAAYTAAIASLNGTAGTIYFPEGEYLFSSGISIPDSVFLKGESSATLLNFNLGGTGNLIHMNGSLAATQYALAATALKGTHELHLADASALQVGDVIRLFQFDEDVMFSTWAYGTLGQVVEIAEMNGNTITLADPLNHHYPMSKNPYVRKLNPRRAAGMECLRIVREDATTGQTSNIYISNAFNCAIRNVESENCNFGHLEVNSSAHIQIEGCYFHHAHAYGGGGQGYGVVYQVASSFCLTQNNIFERLRHSMLIQSGANGNVFGYNYSYDPFWVSGFLPSNSAGDAVLHGNYTYMNLFEGNTIQNIVVDASHGKNGPFNTFFRNRAELYGFFSDNSTTSDSMNVVGNEITNSGFPYGMYMVNGLGHYTFGNNVSGTVNPSGTSNVTANSLYLNESDLPGFLSAEALPMAGYPLAMDQKLLPAENRFVGGEPVDCSAAVITSLEDQAIPNEPLAVLMGSELSIHPSLLPASVQVFSVDGKLLRQFETESNRTVLNLPSGTLLLFRITGSDGQTATVKGMVY